MDNLRKLGQRWDQRQKNECGCRKIEIKNLVLQISDLKEENITLKAQVKDPYKRLIQPTKNSKAIERALPNEK
ncbi:unnamed protein product [Hermetia illucens]|uniref:Uncharacterized protein n=1 Tax=Hermetia illucens TaxID=343691 RepID=A0A7R8UQS5_HERIL|nr:unnamed protein product [Hermetia illucens]